MVNINWTLITLLWIVGTMKLQWKMFVCIPELAGGTQNILNSGITLRLSWGTNKTLTVALKNSKYYKTL